MSEADKMFEELGYEKKKLNFVFSRFWEEWTNEDLQKNFSFNTEYKIIDITDENKFGITIQELKAINLKCKELRLDRGVICMDKEKALDFTITTDIDKDNLKSKIIIGKERTLEIYTEQKFNKLQKKMWKLLLGIKIEDII